MSQISVLSAPLPTLTRKSEDDAYFSSKAFSSKLSLAVPDSFQRPSSSRTLSSVYPKECGISSLPASPVSSAFPQRPGFRRAATTTAASCASTAESTRFDELHYSQTHFSRSTLLVYADSEATLQATAGPEQDDEEDIRELLASSDEESSLPPSTPGFEGAKIPPRSSSSLVHNKQSMESDKSFSSSIEPITLLSPPSAPAKRNGLKISRPSTELVGKTPRATMSASQYDDGSVRSSASSSGSFKRRSRILMKIIPFAREHSNQTPAQNEKESRFNSFPRLRSKDQDEPIETLAERFSDLTSGPLLSPPLSASSFRSTFSSSPSGGTSSSPATSPELGQLELSSKQRSGSHGRRPKSSSSRESVRALFHSASSHSLNAKATQQSQESEWEKELREAAERASWHSSINHRPRPQSSGTQSKHAAPKQSTWPRTISSPVHQRDSLMLGHVFVDASDDGRSSQYSSSGYDSLSGLPMSACPSQASNASSAAQYSLPPRPAYTTPAAERSDNNGQGKFGTLPRVKVRRPSTTGTSVRGEPASFELKAPSMPTTNHARGTASLGRSTTLSRPPVTDAASIWQMGRRRSSGIGGSFSAGGATRMMPTIPQGHSRDNSRADSNADDEAYSWLGIDPYAQGDEVFARGYSVRSARQDSMGSDGSGEIVPLRLGSWRRESQDDLALLGNRRRSSSNASSASSVSPGAVGGAAPVFNLHPFQKRPGIVRSSTSQVVSSSSPVSPIFLVPRGAGGGEERRRFSRSATVPDVPEAVTSDGEDNDALDVSAGWCRRRSTFSSALDPKARVATQVPCAV